MLRRACVAGQFYPRTEAELEEEVKGYLCSGKIEKAKAVIAPHAGYMYSGHVAGAIYSSVEIPDDVILIGPNHTGLGENVSVMTGGEWEMPFGMVEINTELAEKVAQSSPLFRPDASAHLREHSLEVQLPFIHYRNGKTRFVPVTVMRAGKSECRELGAAIADVIINYGKEVLITVSSDMNHYETDERTREKDELAIKKVIELDPDGLLEVTGEYDITMCGVLPTAIALNAVKRLGATEARLVKYATSGEISGDFNQVVGYAGILIK
jgi:AmmeMemoRadiSam system protein B